MLHSSKDYSKVFYDNAVQQNEIMENFVLEEVCLFINNEFHNNHKNVVFKPFPLESNSLAKSNIWKPPVKL